MLAIFYIGRIDTPFLANEVDKFDFLSNAAYLDRAPVYYRKDLLLHEAHRHPYIERLGALFLLKLNYGKKFGTRGGSAWRLLYVMTLMPWLKKYRASVRQMDYTSMGSFGKSLGHVENDETDGEAQTAEQPLPVEKKSSKTKKKPSGKKSKKKEKETSIKKGPSISTYDSSDFVAKEP